MSDKEKVLNTTNQKRTLDTCIITAIKVIEAVEVVIAQKDIQKFTAIYIDA